MIEKQTYIIDFDSTFTQVEALDVMARISQKRNPDRQKIFDEIELLTNMAMDGTLSFTESLERRVALLKANKSHLKQLIRILKRRVSASFNRNRKFFKDHSDQVYIFSGGFKDFILPVVKDYHFLEENIYANTFIYDDNENIIGYDIDNPLSREGGKVKLLTELNLKGQLIVIGDGYSDFQMKEAGLIHKFFAFTENIQRSLVTKMADHVTPSFDEFLYINKLPMSISYPKNRIIAIVSQSIDQEAVDQLKKEGYAIQQVKELTNENCKEAGLILLSPSDSIQEIDFALLSKLKTIGYFGKSKKSLIPIEICTLSGIVIFDDPNNNPRNIDFIPKRMIKFMNGGSTYLSCNFPNIQLPEIENAHRLIHIHKNIPGIMAKVNGVLAKYDINILGQYLRTNNEIGYVITDVNMEYNKDVINDLKGIDQTIKFRLLY